MGKYDDVLDFLKTIDCDQSDFSKFGIDCDHIDHSPNMNLIARTTGYTNKLLLSNKEMIYSDPLIKRYQYMFDVTIDADDEDTLDELYNRLCDHVYKFNYKQPIIYNKTLDFEDDFDANELGVGVPDGWSGLYGMGVGWEFFEIVEHLTHPKCVKLDMNNDAFANITLYRAITNTTKPIYKFEFNRALTQYSDVVKYAIDADGSYASSKGYAQMMPSTTGWEKITIYYNTITDTYDIYKDDVLVTANNDLGSIDTNYVLFYNGANFGTIDGLLYIDDVKLYYFDTYSQPSDMLHIEILNQGEKIFNQTTKRYKCTYRIKVKFTT